MKASYRNIPASHTVNRNPQAADFYTYPYRDYAQWHSRHPVFYWQDYDLWCVCSFADVNRILRDDRFGRQCPIEEHGQAQKQLPATATHLKDFRRLEQHSLLNLEPPAHTRLRRVINHAFTHRKVQALLPEIESLAQLLLERISHQRQTELLANYAAPLAAGVIAKLVGAPDSAIPDLLAWSHAMVRVYTLTQTHEEEVAANQAAIEFSTFLHGLIAEKRAHAEDDLLSSLLHDGQTGQTDGLSDDEIVSIIALLLNAGHEATVHQIGNAVRLLLTETRDPGSYFATDANSTSPEQSQMAIKTVQELMRVDTPLHLFKRCARQTLSLDAGNYLTLELEAGEEVALLLGAANHDPLMFESPQQFNPAREPLDQLSLGAGTHFCVGALLAQHEIRIALATLFHTLPTLQLRQTPEYADTFHFRGLRELQVSW